VTSQLSKPTVSTTALTRLAPRRGSACAKPPGCAAAIAPGDPQTDGDPRTETRAAAAHIVGVLWATASQGVTVKELRAATGMTRERLESAYEYLLAHGRAAPPRRRTARTQ
jgi:hypothetical protein